MITIKQNLAMGLVKLILAARPNPISSMSLYIHNDNYKRKDSDDKCGNLLNIYGSSSHDYYHLDSTDCNIEDLKYPSHPRVVQFRRIKGNDIDTFLEEVLPSWLDEYHFIGAELNTKDDETIKIDKDSMSFGLDYFSNLGKIREYCAKHNFSTNLK
jgi:hypothetical protein